MQGTGKYLAECPIHLQILWEKLRVPEERRTALLQCWKGVGSKDIAGLHTEVRRLEDKLQRAREAERIAQGKALRNTILLVDQMEPKWMEMQAERVKGKVLKSIPPTNKAAERMMTDELKNAGKAEQRATKKRKELFARFDSANSWTPRLDQQLLKKFKVMRQATACLRRWQEDCKALLETPPVGEMGRRMEGRGRGKGVPGRSP